MDLKLNTTGDLDLSTGDAQMLTGTQAARQRIEVKLRFFKGEWFLAPNFGVPYFRDILVKNPQTDVVRNTLVKAIETEAGVDKVTEFVLEYSPTSRTLNISSFRALVDGDFVDFANFELVEL
jgi:hypothetical protein